MELLIQGAEAKIYSCKFLGFDAVVKHRFEKLYRHAELDKKLRTMRMMQEVRLLNKAKNYVDCPKILFVDTVNCSLIIERIDGPQVMQVWEKNIEEIALLIGKGIANLHAADICHGDLTTSNMIFNKKLYFLDFGLSSVSSMVEEKAVDLYVLERCVLSTHSEFAKTALEFIFKGYKTYKNHVQVEKRLSIVRARGRKRSMVG